MIGRIRGIILEKQPPSLLIEVNGIGYEVAAPMTTFYHLPENQEEVTLHTHFVVREDAQTLYGFAQSRDRDLFRILIKVNGVGPKLALTILSGMEVNLLLQCVRDNDTNSLVNIPGIGAKTAERLMLELRSALKKYPAFETPESRGTTAEPASQDAISALTTLGYKPNEAKKAIQRIQRPDLSSEQLIRLALQHMTTGATNT